MMLIGALALAGCATVPTRDAVHDPLEGLNRASHGVNKAVDAVALRPASIVYDTVVPDPVAQGVDNFARNLDHPGRMVNNLLQGDAPSFGRNLFRFIVNTSFGLGGVFDPASAMGLTDEATDFGETLYVWGAGEGPYLELPLAGPSNLRDTVGRVADTAMNPVRLVVTTDAQRLAQRQVSVANVLGDRARNATLIDPILYDSADSYAQLRDSFMQARRFQLTGGVDSGFDEFGVDPLDDPFASN